MSEDMMRTIEDMCILIVDDSRTCRNLIHSFLSGAKFTNLVMTKSAVEAFGILGMSHPSDRALAVDLILMDIVMKGVSGIEATLQIKQTEALCDVPIVMITGSEKKETFEEAFTAGAVDYISKPVDKMELRVRVRSALKLKREIDLRKQRERELELLSSLDGLTGIANRRVFDSALENEWKRDRREGKPLSVVMIDIDYFKPYNDYNGHQIGDDCLKQIGRALGSVPKRAGDLVARYGGEEFVVILPRTDSVHANGIAERLRAKVISLAIPHPYPEAAKVVSVSLGVATVIPTQNGSPADLLNMADKALYQAKKGGRNKVVVFLHDWDMEPESEDVAKQNSC